MGDDALSWLLLFVKLALYASALLAAGLALHTALGVVERAGQPAMLKRAAAAAIASAAFCGLRLVITNAQLSGGLATALDATTFAWAWAAQASTVIATALSSLGMCAALLFRSRIVAGLSAMGLAVSFGLTGHAQAFADPGFAPWAVAAHVLIAAFWFAAPVSLWPAGQLDPATLAQRNRRFSSLAVAAVPVLFVLGLWLVWRIAGSIDAVITSTYGRLLLVKLTVAAAALGLGAFNKLVVTGALEADPARGRLLLSRTLRLDTVLFATALALVAWATTMVGPPDAQ
ncbi:MAG: CopD family protein [Vitreimonas sp.]